MSDPETETSSAEAPLAEPQAASPVQAVREGVATRALGVPIGAGKLIPAEGAPSYLFLAIVSVVTLGLDLGTKAWAEKALDLRPPVTVVANYVDFILARNKGGAWGLLQTTSELVRRPFFLLVSALAIGFIVTLFSRLQPRQRALRWGLPLVLGGALGNVFDRIHYGWVIDFIDVHVTRNGIEHHWPTFNVADIAICVGVGLMAIDMIAGKRPARHVELVEPEAPAPPEPAPEAPEEKLESPQVEAASEPAAKPEEAQS